MEVKLTLESKALSKEDVRHLIQSIRDCEMKYFKDKEISIMVEVPELSTAECNEILTSITPPYNGPLINLFRQTRSGSRP